MHPIHSGWAALFTPQLILSSSSPFILNKMAALIQQFRFRFPNPQRAQKGAHSLSTVTVRADTAKYPGAG